jgi:AraC family transcriptional activator of pobA
MLENIKKYKFENNHPLEFEILDLEKLTHSRKDKIYIPHRTNFYHIFFFEKCNPVHNIDFHSVKIKPYSLLFINKDSVHIFDSKSQYKGKLIIFTEDFFYQSENDRLFLQSTILFNDLLSTQGIELEKDNSEFSLILKQMELELKKEIDANQHYILKNFLHNLLLLSERAKRTSGYSEIKKGLELDITIMFKDLMNENFLKLKTVSSYSKLMQISEKKLTLATTKIIGKTPKVMIDDRIMLEAKRLLTYTNKSIREIGYILGFDEPTNFTKYFRNNATKTPLEFREKYIK